MHRALNFLSRIHRFSRQVFLSFGPRLAGVLLAAAGWSFADASAQAQLTGEAVTLRSFNGINGQQAEYALTPGNDGNYYGVTQSGGTNSAGAFFRLAPDGTLTLLHSFDYNGDGAYPECTLALANDGNFYGTTSAGGAGGGSGTVFQATPGGTVTVLYTFVSSNTIDGLTPVGGVVQGSDGKLYGTTSSGGTNNDGTVFQLSLDGTFVSLHTFNFHTTGAGPYDPMSPLVQGSDGNFYGVANGGDNAVGAIYQLTPGGTVTTIHSFSKTDGSSPTGTLVEGSSGVFYGVTSSGGGTSGNGYGTIFKVTSAGQLTTLHAFAGGVDGYQPFAGLVHAADGNFYGTTRYGGAHGVGNIFQCTPAGVTTNLYSFNGNTSTSGAYPYGGLVQAADGSFYGLTQSGGASNYGTVYRLTVYPHPPFFNGETDLSNGVEYLAFSTGHYFGYYSYLTDPHYIYHFDLGYEYVFDAADGNSGVYLYDFKSSDFFYTSPGFPFPYLYDFNLSTVLYYYPDPSNTGHYNTKGVRYFYNFATGKIISK